MDNSQHQSQTSFQQEFNRLSFLASIATGTSPSSAQVDSSSLLSKKSDGNTPIKEARTINAASIQNVSIANNLNGLHVNITKTISSSMNGLSKAFASSNIHQNQNISQTNVGKINSLLISPNLQSTQQPSSIAMTTNSIFVTKPTMSTSILSSRHLAVRPRIYSPRATQNVQQIRPQMPSPRLHQSNVNISPHVSASYPTNQTSSTTPTKVSLAQSFISPNASLSVAAQLATSTKTVIQQQQQQQLQQQILFTVPMSSSNVPISSSNATVPTGIHSLNPQLVITQAQPGISTTAKILAQPSISTSTGQTILLPANFAGMSGKVFIVNNPGKAPQAIALTPSSGSTQQTATTQPAAKPLLLLPNSVQQKAETKTLTSLQQRQVVNQALQMIAAHNTSPQVRIQQPSVANQPLPRLQQVQPVSMSAFQNIRPKSFLQNIKNIQPKSAAESAVGKVSINQSSNSFSNQGLRLSHFPGQTSNSIRQSLQTSVTIGTSVTISPSYVTVPSAQQNQTSSESNVLSATPQNVSTSSQASVLSNSSLLTNFDKTMSQHLQTLEKTDPHLFLQSSGTKLQINQLQKPAMESNASTKVQLQQDKLKQLLQSSAQSLPQTSKPVQTSFFQQHQPSQIVKNVSQTALSGTNMQLLQTRQDSLKPNFCTSHSVSLTPQVSSVPPVSVATQILTMPQKQQVTLQKHQANLQKHQANLQNILKQQQQQQNQRQQLLLHSNLVTGSQQQQIANLPPQQQQVILQQARQQLLLQQQQQKQTAQNQPELFLMQQKLLQAQTQQKVAQQIQIITSQASGNNPQVIQNNLAITPQKTNLTITPQKCSMTALQTSRLQPNPPLKLLSSLTNMVNTSPLIVQTTASGMTSTSVGNHSVAMGGIVTPSISVQQNIRPVLVQMPGGATQMLNAAQLTPAQLLELQKCLLASQGKQVTIPTACTQTQSQIAPTSIINTVRQHKPGMLMSTISTKVPLQNLAMRPDSLHAKSAFAPKLNKIVNQSNSHTSRQVQQILQKNHVASNSSVSSQLKLQESAVISKVLQEQLKQFSPAQREQILKHYAAGKIGAISTGSANLSGPMLLASILKNKQVLSVSSSAAAGSMKPSVSTAHHKKVTTMTKLTSRGLKRPVEIMKAEPEEHRFAKRWKGLLLNDHKKYASSHYKSPFTSIDDAITQLLPYHVGQEPENQIKDYWRHDLLFHTFAKNVQERKCWLIEQLNLIILEDSQVNWPSSTYDDIWTEHLFVAGEEELFHQQKKAILEGRAFVVKNEVNNRLECVELAVKDDVSDETPVSSNSISINLSEEQQLDNRLRIAHKDIRNVVINVSEDDNDGEDDDDDNDDDIDDVDEDDTVEEIEIDEIPDPIAGYRVDSELAAATTNLLADLQQDDEYKLDFGL